jgi:hypothetical protein
LLNNTNLIQMKKTTLFSNIAVALVCGIFSAKSYAQITISQTDMPSAGLTVITATDSTSGYMPGNPSASAQVWNFAALNHQKTANISFMAPSSTKYAAKFPTATLADSTAGVIGYDFFIVNSGEFAVEGSEQIVTYSGYYFQVEINLAPVFVQSNLSATYNDKVNGVSRGHEEFGTTGILAFVYDSVKLATSITYSDTVDAFGTMTTPTGTYQVLRQNHHEVDVDSITGRSTAGKWSSIKTTITKYHQYNWYANNIGYILVQMNMDTTSNTVKNVIWDSTAPASINELSISGRVSVYPNPCTSQITFQAPGNDVQFINVYDIAGRKLDQVEMKNGMNTLNTSSYASGMYLYTLADRNGNILDRGKFMVK